MLNLENILEKDPFSLKSKDKKLIYAKYINNLTLHHYNNCKEYAKILDFTKLFNPNYLKKTKEETFYTPNYVNIESFEEGSLPRKLFQVTLRKK